MTATEEFVRWAWSLEIGDVPEEVRRAGCRHLLDGLGNAIGAARMGAATFAVDVAMQFSAPPESTVIGSGFKIPAPMAALANGTLVHALDYDDTHAGGLVHPTATVLPTAFALGEQTGASGRDILLAAICGLETITRLGAAAPHGFHARGLHATSVCGVFGAALVASRLAGLSEAQTVDALGIAGSTSSGLLEFLNTGSSTKQFHPGWAAMSGIIASRLAASGASGPSTVLEGNFGLYQAYAGTELDAAKITNGLGTRWETSEITIKPYPACQLSHATLDALRAASPSLASNDIDNIVCTIPHESVPIIFEPLENKVAPRTEYEAKFSLPWSAAALLIDGELGVDSFGADRRERPEILDLARRISYRSWDPGVPAAAAPGKVEIRLVDGRVFPAEVSASRGGPGVPLSDEELTTKFVDNCGGSSNDFDDLIRMVMALEEQPNLERLIASAKPSRALLRTS